MASGATIAPFHEPLYPSMGLGVAIVSYNGDAYLGLTADPGIVPDVEEFTARLEEAAARCTELCPISFLA